MCNVLFHVPQVGKRWGSKIFFASKASEIVPTLLKNRGTALVCDVQNFKLLMFPKFVETCWRGTKALYYCRLILENRWQNGTLYVYNI